MNFRHNTTVTTFLTSTLVTSLVISVGMAVADSAWWLLATVPLAAIAMAVFRNEWLPAIELWKEHPRLCYVLLATFGAAALVTAIWGFETLLVIVGALVATFFILLMMDSNSDYKRKQRRGEVDR